MKLKGRRIHLAGSADNQSDEGKLRYAHELIAKLTNKLAEEGCNFVLPFGKEPRLQDKEDGPSIIFDWTIAETVGAVLKSGNAKASSPNGRLFSTVATSRTSAHIPSNRSELYNELRGADSMKIEFLEPGWTSGAYQRSRLAQLGDVLICLSGGQGVEQLAVHYSSAGKPVIPLDLQIGSSAGDGSGGAARLFDRARAEPNKFFKVNSSQDGVDLFDRTRTNQGTESVDKVVESIMRLLAELVPPSAFYVRLLNPAVTEYSAVENFFRTSVDDLVRELGYEPLQMGLGKNEFAWMNKAIFDSLHHSEVVVIDLTGLRTNCFMELGYALGNNQRVILTAMQGTPISFDACSLEAFMWIPDEDPSVRLEKFRTHWTRNIDMPPLVSPIEAK